MAGGARDLIYSSSPERAFPSPVFAEWKAGAERLYLFLA
jgi:hypothetical protein